MITFDSEKRLFQLNTPNSTYIIFIGEENYLLHGYYGRRLPDAEVSHFLRRRPSASFSPSNPRIQWFSADVAPMEYSCNGAGDFRVSALAAGNADGNAVTDVRYVAHRIYAGAPDISPLPHLYAQTDADADTLEVICEDAYTGLRVTLRYTVFNHRDAIVRSAQAENRGDKPLTLERIYSTCLDLPEMKYDLITLWGRHVQERTVERRPLAHGLQGVCSKRGVSGHSQNPFAALAAHGADEDQGDVYGFNLIYSGNFDVSVECDHNAATRVIMGINPEDFCWNLAPGETFQAPEAVMVFSPFGLGGMSREFHRLYADHLIRGRYQYEKRPLLINSWEAAYFDFDDDKLVAFARQAKELGVELLVMDDGWFGKRNDDTNSLGDWVVNTKKLKGGLASLSDRLHAQGMKFGIWFEPEMISPDSDLFRAHPDWCVHVPGREPSIARHQYVLDVSRADVRDNIFDQMCAVLRQTKIEYVKWDFNRNISEAGSALLPARQGREFFHRFILGTYDLLDRLTKAFPEILFEGCSGGGGRFDPGMLYFTPQIWTSDNTDPIDRLDIQFGTSLCYPASAMGAHVSACDRTGYETKGDVALWGTFGYELDPCKLSEADKEIVKRQVKEYHKYYDLIHFGDLYRLITPAENERRCAWQMVSRDRTQTLVTAVTMRRYGQLPFYLKLRGLDPDAYYRAEDGKVYSGALLMYAGLDISDLTEDDGQSVKLYFEQTEK